MPSQSGVASGRAMPKFHYDDSGYFAYVLLRARPGQPRVKRSDADYAARLLRDAGISTDRIGQSNRRADNGRQYEWYIRVTDCGSKPDRGKIRRALIGTSIGAGSPTSELDTIELSDMAELPEWLEYTDTEGRLQDRPLLYLRTRLPTQRAGLQELLAKIEEPSARADRLEEELGQKRELELDLLEVLMEHELQIEQLEQTNAALEIRVRELEAEASKAVVDVVRPEGENGTLEAQAAMWQLQEDYRAVQEANQGFQTQIRLRDETVRQLGAEKTQLESEIGRLRDEFARAASPRADNSSRVSKLQRELAQESEAKAKLAKDNEQLRTTVEHLESERQDAASEKADAIRDRDAAIEELRKVYGWYKAACRRANEDPPVLDTGEENEVEMVITTLLPDVVFLRGSLTLMRQEMRTDLVLGKVQRIVQDGIAPDDTIRREGHPAWREYHLSTGRGREDGRLYHRRGGDHKDYILVSWKEAQKSDIEELFRTGVP